MTFKCVSTWDFFHLRPLPIKHSIIWLIFVFDSSET